MQNQTLLSRIAVFAAALAAAYAVFFVSPETAMARPRIPIPVHWGEEFFDAGPLPAPYDSNPELAGKTAGYKCNVKGLFWTYVMVSDCTPVAHDANSFFEDEGLSAAITATYNGEMQMGLWAKWGWILFAVLAVLAVIGFFLPGGDDDEEEAEA